MYNYTCYKNSRNRRKYEKRQRKLEDETKEEDREI